jgi:hypothetical protein
VYSIEEKRGSKQFKPKLRASREHVSPSKIRGIPYVLGRVHGGSGSMNDAGMKVRAANAKNFSKFVAPPEKNGDR